MMTYEESATELEMDLSGINLANDGIRFAAKYKGRSFPVVIPLDAVRYGLSFPPEYIDSKDARQIIEQNTDRVHAAIREAYRLCLVDKTDKVSLVVARDCF